LKYAVWILVGLIQHTVCVSQSALGGRVVEEERERARGRFEL